MNNRMFTVILNPIHLLFASYWCLSGREGENGHGSMGLFGPKCLGITVLYNTAVAFIDFTIVAHYCSCTCRLLGRVASTLFIFNLKGTGIDQIDTI